MLGLGLGLSLASRPASPGPAPVGHLRIVPNGATSAFVIAPHDDLGAIGYGLIFGNDGSTATPPSSIGAPFGGWRWASTVHLASVESDPTDPIAVLHEDIGSVDSAMQGNFGASLYGGHYHGGITITSTDVPDMSEERYVSSFSFGYTATITWPTGETADVTYALDILPGGDLAGSILYDSEASFFRVFGSMVIASAFTHYSTDDGETWLPASAQGTYSLGSADSVIMRQGSSGYEIEVGTGGSPGTGVTREIINNDGTRLKHYVRWTSAGNPLGQTGTLRTIAFRQTEPDPPPTDLFHWVGAVDGETWLEVPVSAAVYLDGAGNCVLERGTHTAVAYHRAIWEMAGLEPETTYRLPISATAEGSDSAGCWIDIILSSNGSTTGARASDFLKDAMDRGYIDFTTDAGQTTLYAMIRQQPQADSVEVARVSELGPLEVAP